MLWIILGIILLIVFISYEKTEVQEGMILWIYDAKPQYETRSCNAVCEEADKICLQDAFQYAAQSITDIVNNAVWNGAPFPSPKKYYSNTSLDSELNSQSSIAPFYTPVGNFGAIEYLSYSIFTDLDLRPGLCNAIPESSIPGLRRICPCISVV